MFYCCMTRDTQQTATFTHTKKKKKRLFHFGSLLNGKCPVKFVQFHFFETSICCCFFHFFLCMLCECVHLSGDFFCCCWHWYKKIKLWSCLSTNYISISCFICNDYNLFLSIRRRQTLHYVVILSSKFHWERKMMKKKIWLL